MLRSDLPHRDDRRRKPQNMWKRFREKKWNAFLHAGDHYHQHPTSSPLVLPEPSRAQTHACFPLAQRALGRQASARGSGGGRGKGSRSCRRPPSSLARYRDPHQRKGSFSPPHLPPSPPPMGSLPRAAAPPSPFLRPQSAPCSVHRARVRGRGDGRHGSGAPASPLRSPAPWPVAGMD